PKSLTARRFPRAGRLFRCSLTCPAGPDGQYFFSSSTRASRPLRTYRLERRCSSAEGASTFWRTGFSRFCRFGTHTLPSANSTWLTKPVILRTFTGWPLLEKFSVLSWRTRAFWPGGRYRLGSDEGSDPAMYWRP